jgi:hypothetical protein
MVATCGVAGLLLVGTTATAMGSYPDDDKKDDKVTICHHTGSDTNPYVKITISKNALEAHKKHGDVYPNKYGKCPKYDKY